MVKIQVTKHKSNIQYHITIPIVIIKAMNWDKGIDLKFEIKGKDKLQVERAKT